MSAALRILEADIAQRAGSLIQAHAHWPCRKGCDACCRRLAAPPSLTAPEWERLREGIASLPAHAGAEVASRIEAMPAAGPLTCPFLDRAEAACMVYEYRPVACRTYGFYRERDRGLYCEELHSRVERGEFGDPVWGNAAAIGERLRACGETRTLREWSQVP